MAKELECAECGKDLGVIRDGNISKGLKPVCTKCYNIMSLNSRRWEVLMEKRDREKLKEKPKPESKFVDNGTSFNEILGDVFKDILK
ncbi:MAG: hypothetical protein KAS32_14910 [Candidatus Peribacteraceae bacterium]|nr:hypothetical protein [Candidatus Peribacteraceae bacterium]